MIYTCKPGKIAIYVNTSRKSTTQVKAETGCTALINGGLFDMNTFSPVCHLKVSGQVLAKDKYTYWGFGWNDGDTQLHMVSQYSQLDNYICCVSMVKDGKATNLYYDKNTLGGYRPRTAFGVFEDGRVWLYAETTGRTPEQVQKMALAAGVTHAILLDGGGSTQGAAPGQTVNGSRIVHNYICVWDEDVQQAEPEGVETMFKLALGAGHGINTSGKRCMKSLDPNETREWWLNDRICDYVEDYLRDYEGYKLLRLDDSDDGEENVPLATRTTNANNWGADFYLSVHHNAGVNGGSGGGIVCYTHPQSSKASVEWRNALYDALVKYTGLKGNRTHPKATEDYYVLRKTKMPAVLLELGFMDSKTDVPVILTDEYAQNCAKAIVEVLVKRAGLTKKAKEETDSLYKVQVGAFSKKENAEKLRDELAKKGYPVYMIRT